MSTGPEDFAVRRASWPDDEPHIRRIREAVFVREQSVPLELEWDGKDPACVQVLAHDSYGEAIGTGRMSPSGHIGRMAVLAGRRNSGVGSALLRTLLTIAREQGLVSVYLNAQVEALEFYSRHGFRADGEIFLEAGIPHRRMALSLTPLQSGGRTD